MPIRPVEIMEKSTYDADKDGRIEIDAIEFTLNKILKGAGAGANPTEIDAVTGALVGTTDTQELTNKTLNASVLKGTLANSGTVTLPAVTLGGAISGGGQYINEVPRIRSTNIYATPWPAGFGFQNSGDDNYLDFLGANLYIRTGASGAALATTPLTFTYGATGIWTWATSSHTGFRLTASEKINPVSGVSGFSVVSTALTLGSLGSVVIPQSGANVTDALAGNIAGCIGLDLTGTAERLYFRGASGWFYIAKTGGLSMTKEERIDPNGHKFELGDVVKLVVDKINPDDSFHASPYFGGVNFK